MTDDAELSDLLTLRLGYLVKHAYLELAALMAEALEPYGVLPRELGVLSVIGADGAERSQNELASAIGMDRTTMVAVIDELEGRGLVERHRSARDRRRNVVTLTDAGVTCLRDAELARAEAEAAYLAPLEPDAAQALTDALRVLHRAHAAPHGGRPLRAAGPTDQAHCAAAAGESSGT
ncbi:MULTISPECIES: MarR family winged helix-turn-helix transcriptional regulator [unclassified Streptomyces]|uniref:MarR family winged helix-turn-helix transcriptional regulator n=1 Tax=unclassified Streptomyces TaxID=2593676 RepID=UPI002E15EC32|nr:MarR family winged helix-turn-helix transcriptional regulator [Streptomyces sp. NBC_01281]